MKKIIALVLFVTLCLSFAACGAGGNNYKASGDGWFVDENGVLFISEMKDNKIPEYTYSDPAPWYQYRMMINSIKIEEGITHIGSLAFNGCEKAENLELPSTLLQIADKGFTFCSALKSVTLPDSVNYVGLQAFQGCVALESVTWSKEATTIWNGTFTDCSALKTVVLPEGVMHLHREAFKGCTALKTIAMPDSLATFEDDTFVGCTGVKVQCKAGSDAETMAVKHGVDYELIG